MTTGRLAGKVAIVTGAGQGIGEGIAHVFAREGAAVVIATRTAQNGQAVADAITRAGGQAALIQTDVADLDQIEAMVAQSVERFGGLDIMVHNAAAFGGDSVAEHGLDTLDHILNVNLRAAFSLSRAAIPHLRARGGGRLLFTSSVTGPRVVMPGSAAYGASKGGLNAFIRTAALELAAERITVNGVEPGYILTQAMALLSDEEGLRKMAHYIPAGHLGTPDDIAHAMLFLASDEAGYVTGQTILVDGGSTLPESPLFFDQPKGG